MIKIDSDCLGYYQEVMLADAAALTQSYSLPVPVEDIAEQLGVSVRSGSMRKIAAALCQKNDNSFEIVLPKTSEFKTPRTRFTIAHEIGHFLMYKHWGIRPQTIKERSLYFKIEKLCNLFASRLLVPYHYLDGISIVDVVDGFSHLSDIASKGEISTEVASKALSEFFHGIGFMHIIRHHSKSKDELFWYVNWSTGVIQHQLSINSRSHLELRHDLVSVLSQIGDVPVSELRHYNQSSEVDFFYSKDPGRMGYTVTGITTQK